MSITKKNNSNKRFLALFTLLSVIIMLCIGYTSYKVDPFFQYRVQDNKYLLNPRFVNPGLIRNGDYNTVIIGSSMVQNYDLSILRRNPEVKPIKIASGAMSIKETELMYSLIDKEKVNHFIISLDIVQFTYEYPENRYPDYLYEEGIGNKLKYLFGYETCMRYIPADIAIETYLKYTQEVPLNLALRINIDNIGNFSQVAVFNKETVKQAYLNNTSSFDANAEESHMRKNLDSMLVRLGVDENPTIDYTFILPPYSSLYWGITQNKGYYTNFIHFVRYMTTQMEKHKNVKLVCFYDVEEINNLDNYTDVTHFSPAISKLIVENIDTPAYYLNSSNIDSRMERLDSLVAVFKDKNKSWLKQ